MKKWKKIAKAIGPGFITGASDDDPSGIATYSQTGAQFGLTQLWMALFSFPFMVVIQEMCGRIGLVTGKGLAGVIRHYYGRRILVFTVTLLVVANTINIGADLGAMASAVQLLFPIPFVIPLILLTALTIFLEIFVPYHVYVKVLKYFGLTLFSYVATAFIIKAPWRAIAYATLIPQFSWSKEYLLNIVALLGTTISPYLFFWQANEEVEEEITGHKLKAMGVGTPHINKGDVHTMRWDTLIGMFFSNLVTFFIIVTTASTLGAHGIKNIETAADAAAALRPLAGSLTSLLFTLGILGTGLLTVPVLAGSSSYAISESMHWREGLFLKLKQAHKFYGIIFLATIIGLLVNFIGISPFKMLYYTAVLNGIVAPPLMVVIIFIANNKKILGNHTNGRWSNVLGILVTVVMSSASLALLYAMIF